MNQDIWTTIKEDIQKSLSKSRGIKRKSSGGQSSSAHKNPKIKPIGGLHPIPICTV